jgi:uncharacterized protein YbjQ (UPF0145 family)
MDKSEEMYEIAEKYRSENENLSAKAIYSQIIVNFPASKEAGFSKFRLNNLEYPEIEKYKNLEGLDSIDSIKITTAPFLEGFKVVETIDIITSECASGMGFIADFFTSLSDTFGGKSGILQKTLRIARKNCLMELKKEAQSLGANAVIAVDLDYSEFSGKGKSMVFVVASGTAVIVEKKLNDKKYF